MEEEKLSLEGLSEELTLESLFCVIDKTPMFDLYHLSYIVERVEKNYGVKIRYPEDWLKIPAKYWISRVNRMMRENRFKEGIVFSGKGDLLPSGMICIKDREFHTLYEYDSKEEMIDDGWVLD